MDNQIEIYQTADNQTALTVRFESETVWLNRQQLSVLFDRDVKTIGKHINNIFEEHELEENRTVAKFATVPFSLSSPSKNTLFICFPIVLISLPNNLAN